MNKGTKNSVEIKELFENPAFYKGPTTPLDQEAEEKREVTVEMVDELEDEQQEDAKKELTPESEPIDDGRERTFKVIDRRFITGNRDFGDRKSQSSSRQPKYVEQLEQQLSERDRNLKDYIVRFKQEKEEMESFKVRQRREVERTVDREKSRFFNEFLELLDNFERSMATEITDDNYRSVLDGFRMIHQQIGTLLLNHGVIKTEVKARPFDPKFSEAVDVVPVEAEEMDETIVEELQCGYMYKDMVIRAAKVRVGKYNHGDANEQRGD